MPNIRTPEQKKKAMARAKANRQKKTATISMGAKKKTGVAGMKAPVYRSGFDSRGNRIDFSNPKTKRGIITSLD